MLAKLDTLAKSDLHLLGNPFGFRCVGRKDDKEVWALGNFSDDAIPPVVASVQAAGCIVPDGLLTQIGAQIGAQIGDQTEAERVILMAVAHKEQA